MKRFRTLASYIVASIVAFPAGIAQGLSVDWKFYGGASLGGDSHDFCFYDAKGVAHARDGHLRVWTKCLTQNDLDNIDTKTELGAKIVDNTAEKIARYYFPPFAAIETLNFDQMMRIVTYEVIANIGDIQPRAQIFYELNCLDRMLRELSIDFVDASGKRGSSHKASDWRFVPPEGNGASLLELLCPSR